MMHHGDAPHDGHGHVHRGGHHRFEDAEAWAQVFDDPARDAWQKPDAVLDFMKLAPDATVADIGAGTGYFAVRIARRLPRGTVLATDIEPDMVRWLTDRARDEGIENLVALRSTADDPGLDRPVDVAFMCDVFHHLEDPPRFFGRLRERLARDGRIVIVDFDPRAPQDAPGPPAAMRIAPERIVEQLRPVGLVQSRLDTTTLPYQYILELTRAN